MSISPDRRKPCGGRKLYTVGGCLEQGQKKLKGIPIIRNVTQAKNPISGEAAYVDPYALPDQTRVTDCSPYDPVSGNGGNGYTCGDFINGHLPCWQNTFSPADIQPAGPGSWSVDLGDGYFNVFANTNETTSYSHCQNFGWKNVAASKAWNGRWSYHSTPAAQYPSAFDWCGQCNYVPYVPAPDTVKYLTVAGSATKTVSVTNWTVTFTTDGSIECIGPDGNLYQVDLVTYSSGNPITTTVTETATNTVSIDKFGNVISANLVSGSSDGDNDKAQEAANFLGMVDGDAASLFGTYKSLINSAWAVYGNPASITGNGSAWSVEWHTTTQLCRDDCGNWTTDDVVALKISVDLAAGVVTSLAYGPQVPASRTNSYCINWTVIGSQVWDFGPEGSTTFEYLETDYFYTDSNVITGVTTIEVKGSLGSPYREQDVKSDITTLLSKWDMGNDGQYPWRVDINKTLVPYIHYNEASAIVPLILTPEPTAQQYGQIRGAPLPVGTDNVWSFAHNNWCACNSLVNPGNLLTFVKDHGAHSSDISVPCATEWTDAFQGQNLTDGALAWFNQFQTTNQIQVFDDVLWATKYAEIIFPKYSYNFARPCGADRYQVSGSPFLGDNAVYTGLGSGRCISSVSDKTITLDPSGAPTDCNTGDYVWVCGTGTIDGCWKTTVNNPYSITVNSLQMSASLVPNQPVQNVGSGIIAKLRFQGFQAKMCGIVDIISAQGTPVTCSMGDNTYLVNGDKILVSGAKGIPINGVWTVNVADTGSKTVFLLGSDGSSGTYAGGGGMFTPFSPDNKWNDTTSKGDYSTVSWSMDFRKVAEANWLQYQFDGNVVNNETKCDQSTPCPNPLPPIGIPGVNQANCGVDQSMVNLKPETHCLPNNPCSPSVAYFSPNVESFGGANSVIPSAQNHGHGLNNLSLDTKYGSAWGAVVLQSMNDPIWQSPPCPCSIDPATGNYTCNFFWIEDDGYCNADDPFSFLELFPHIDQYEYRMEPPDGAPALPLGVYMGFSKLSDYTSPTKCPNGNVFQRPIQDITQMTNGVGGGPGDVKCPAYVPFPYAIPWIVWAEECACVKGQGRFATQYSQNLVNCNPTQEFGI